MQTPNKESTITLTHGGKSVTMTDKQLKSVAKKMGGKDRAKNIADKYGLQEKDVADEIEGKAKDVGGVAGKRLRSFLERIERLEAEKAGMVEDIKEVYAEAKGVGFDAKTMRRIIRLRKMEVEKRREENELLELYASAIGMQYALAV